MVTSCSVIITAGSKPSARLVLSPDPSPEDDAGTHPAEDSCFAVTELPAVLPALVMHTWGLLLAESAHFSILPPNPEPWTLHPACLTCSHTPEARTCC